MDIALPARVFALGRWIFLSRVFLGDGGRFLGRATRSLEGGGEQESSQKRSRDDLEVIRFHRFVDKVSNMRSQTDA